MRGKFLNMRVILSFEYDPPYVDVNPLIEGWFITIVPNISWLVRMSIGDVKHQSLRLICLILFNVNNDDLFLRDWTLATRVTSVLRISKKMGEHKRLISCSWNFNFHIKASSLLLCSIYSNNFYKICPFFLLPYDLLSSTFWDTYFSYFYSSHN